MASARVITACNDASKDMYIPMKEAKKRFQSGDLWIDSTHSTKRETVYILPQEGEVPGWLAECCTR